MRCNPTLEIVSFCIFVLACSFAIGVYECNMGGIAAKVTIKYYDYSIPIDSNSTIRVSIDSLPRDVYKNNKDAATIMLFFGVLGVFASVATAIHGCVKRDVDEFIAGAAVSNALVCLVPFCYSVFLAWKFDSLSKADINTWNSIDPRFIDTLDRGSTLAFITAFPGIIWILFGCILYVSTNVR